MSTFKRSELVTILLLFTIQVILAGICDVKDPWLRSKLILNETVNKPRASYNSRWANWQSMKQRRFGELKGFPEEFVYLRQAVFEAEEGGMQFNRKDGAIDGSINVGQNNDALATLCIFGGLEWVPIYKDRQYKYGTPYFNCSKTTRTPFIEWPDVDNPKLLERYKVDLPNGIVLSSEAQKELDIAAYKAYLLLGAERFLAITRGGTSAIDGPIWNNPPFPPIKREEKYLEYLRAIVSVMVEYYNDPSKLTDSKRYAYVLDEIFLNWKFVRSRLVR